MSTRSSVWRIRAAGLWILSLVALSGCSWGKSFVETSPNQFSATFREDFVVRHVDPSTKPETREVVGYVYRQVANGGNEERHWIQDLRRRNVGLVKEGQVFALVPGKNEKGDSVLTHRELGELGLEQGVARLLRLKGGRVELEQQVAVGYIAKPKSRKTRGTRGRSGRFDN